jgi:hypothetical protein
MMNLRESNLSLQTWERLENYQGPVLAPTRFGLVDKVRALFAPKRRNISRFRASVPLRQNWRDHLRKAA